MEGYEEKERFMKYQLAIFDLDGTILDTLEDLANSLNYALEAEGYPVRSLEEVRRFVGNGMLNLVKRAMTEPFEQESQVSIEEGKIMEEQPEIEAVAKKAEAQLKAHYKIHCADKTKPYDGVIALLQELKQEGYKLAVLSNKADYAVQILCEQYFAGIFDMTAGEKEGVRKKPAPDAVYNVLETFGIAKDQAVYIGDSEVDIKTAENAGMDAVLVTWGFRDEALLRKEGAKRLVTSMEELKRELLG